MDKKVKWMSIALLSTIILNVSLPGATILGIKQIKDECFG